MMDFDSRLRKILWKFYLDYHDGKQLPQGKAIEAIKTLVVELVGKPKDTRPIMNKQKVWSPSGDTVITSATENDFAKGYNSAIQEIKKRIGAE